MPLGHMVGRGAELALLEEQLAGSVATGRRVTLLSGEAGIGKTTLVEHFAEGVRHPVPRANVARGLCVPMGEAGVPFAPVLGVLRSLEELHGSEQIAEWAGGGRGALGTMLPELLEPGELAEGTEGLQLRMFEAVARVVRASSGVRPLVVVVDDVHWADGSSLGLLQFVARTVTEAAVLIIVTFRSDEADGGPLASLVGDLSRLPGATRLPLSRLDRSAVAEMLTTSADGPAPAARVDEIHRRSQGVPFYVAELAAAPPGGAVPEALREVLRSRTRVLADDVRGTVALAAVAGIRVQHALLMAAVSDPEPAERALRAAVDAGLLTVDGEEYVFRHALYAEALYDDLLPGERSRMHAHVAAALERRPDLASGTADHAIAAHWAASGDAERAFAAAVRATRASTVAHAEALAMYERILDLWDSVDHPEATAGPLVEVLTEAARCGRDAGEYHRALELVSAALDRSTEGEADAAGRVDRLLLRALLLTDSIQRGARRDLDVIEELLPAVTEPATRAALLGRTATLRLNIGATPVQISSEPVDAAVALGDPTIEAEARITLGTALGAVCRETEGIAELRRALALPGLQAHAWLRGMLNLSDALHLAGEYHEAVQVALDGLARAADFGMERSFGTYLAGNAAESMLATGEWSRAADLLAEGVSLDPPSSHRTHLELLLAWLHALRGEQVMAAEILHEYRHLIGENQPAPQFALQMMRVDSEYAVLYGDPARAWDNLGHYLDDPDPFNPLATWPLIAVGAAAAAALDSRASAGRREVVRELIERTPATRASPLWRGLAETELADTRDAWSGQVERLHATAAAAHLAPYAQLRLAEHLSAARERTALRQLIDGGTESARAIGARVLVDRLAALARRAGVATAAERPSVQVPLAALTAREVEVLRLVVRGLSNKQIGEELFISVKTASVHVSNILAKLGAGGRAEAAVLAVQHGLDQPV